jgi:hypothetical protein
MRPLLSGLIGAVVAHLLIRWLGQRFPVGPKSHSLDWYAPRYGWVESAALLLFLCGMGVGLSLYYSGYLPRNDPRGAALGFFLGCLLPFAFLCGVCAFSTRRQFREYWDFQELKYGAKNKFSLYLVLPVFALSAYGSLHLLLFGN